MPFASPNPVLPSNAGPSSNDVSVVPYPGAVSEEDVVAMAGVGFGAEAEAETETAEATAGAAGVFVGILAVTFGASCGSAELCKQVGNFLHV